MTFRLLLRWHDRSRVVDVTSLEVTMAVMQEHSVKDDIGVLVLFVVGRVYLFAPIE